MKRSFILLLVVALLATMIPSFALADEAKAKPEIKFNEEKVEKVLTRPYSPYSDEYDPDEYDDPGVSFAAAVTGIEKTSYVKITSNKTAVVSVDKSAREVQNDGNVFYYVTCKSEGEAEITATLYSDKDCTEVLATTEKALKVTVTKKPIEEITFDPEEYEVTVGIEDDVQVGASVSPATSYYSEKDLIWSVGDESVAVVDASGKITGIKVGKTTVTATAPDTGKVKKEAKVTVKEPEKKDEDAAPTLTFTTTELTTESDSLNIGAYLQVTDLGNDSIRWSSSDKTIAYIDDYYTEWDGRQYCDLEFNKPGTVIITAFSRKFPEKKATIKVTYNKKPLESITFANLPTEIKAGTSINLGTYATTVPEDYSLSDLTWSSTDLQVAYVEGYYLYAVNPGPVTITASYDGKKMAEFAITVTDVPVTKVEFAQKAYTLLLGGNPLDMKEGRDYTLLDKDHGTNYKLIWTSSNDDIVSVTEYSWYYRLNPKKAGTATVTLTALNGNGTRCSGEITVTVKPADFEDVAFAEDSLEVTYYEKADEKYNAHDLDLVIKPANAKVTTTWQTSDPDVAYVIDEDNDGSNPTLIATGYGECEITVTATDGTTTKTATLKVKVTKTKTSVKLVLDQTVVKGYMVRGEKNAVVLKATDKNTGAAVPVTWKTSNKKVATVSKKGVVKFKSAGKAVITATTTDGKQTATCNFTIYKLPVRQIARSNRVLTVKLGEKVKLNLKVKPAKAYNPALSFKSSDPKTVAVSKQGYVKGLKVGKAVITITAKDGSGVETSMTIKVVPSTAHNDELIDDTAETLTIDGDLAVDLGSFDDLITDDTEDDAGEITEVTIE